MAFVLLTLGFTLACVVLQLHVGAYSADVGTGGDEAAHVVNGLLVYDYVRHGLFTNPMHFALRYYLHWPRVSIGHWPPLFYPFEAAAFLVGGRSIGSALALQALVAGSAAASAAWLIHRRIGWAAGLAAGLAVLASPLLLFSVDLIMTDTALGLWMVAAALAWARFAHQPGVGRAVLFAACASGAILTKGNGVALALLPVIHAALARDLAPLRDWRAWLAAALVGLVTAPWYVLTYRMMANGFVYSWGWRYTRLAVPFYLHAITTSLGVIGTIGFAIGLLGLVGRGTDRPFPTETSLAALVLALVVFQMLAPADLSARYLIPIVPAGIVVAAQGFARLARAVGLGRRSHRLHLAVAAALLLDAAGMFRMPHVTPYGMDAVAQAIIAAHDASNTVLAAGNDHAEGALIAAFAIADPTQRFYVLRASQELATTNFMGSQYAPRFVSAAEVAHWLQGSGIGWLAIDLSPGSVALRHNRQLLHALRSGNPEWRLVFHATGPRGEVRLYRLSGNPATSAQLRALLLRVAPPSLARRDDLVLPSAESSSDGSPTPR
ncbi:MAG: hypothetical protein M0Z28_23475 [Rhodospirillales bacterium]|nr:hypothetical protein [Rhodospirillales bacterium]